METKLPQYIPILARLGGSYPAGTDEWSSTDVIQEPNVGTISAGLTPGTGSWLTAQTMNFLFGTYSQAIAAMVDAPSFQVKSHAAHVNNGLAWDSPAFTDGNLNTHPGGDPVGIMVADDGWLIVQKRQITARTRFGQGLNNLDADGTEWIDGASCVLTGGSGETVSGIARPVIMCADRETGFLAAFEVGGIMKGSTDRGATWGGSHTIDASLSGKAVTAAFCWNGMVFAAYSIGGGPLFSDVWVADQSDLTTWENAFTASTNGGSSNEFTRVTANATTMVWLNRIGKQLTTLSGSIGAWTRTTVQFDTHTTSSRNWRGAWNEQLGMFMIGNVEGDVWSSGSTGAGWGQVYAAADNLFSTADIVAHGRGFVVSNHKTDWAADYFDIGPDGAWRLRRLLTPYGGNGAPFGAWHLDSVQGRWVAVRHILSGSTWRLEWYTSDVHPWDRNNFVGR